MHWLIGKFVIAAVAAAIAVPIFFLLVNPRAFLQTSKDVVIRDQGHLRLGLPEPAKNEANRDLQFAWLSEVAYQTAGNDERNSAGFGRARERLERLGWQEWPIPLSAALQKSFIRRNLRVQVWKNPVYDEVAVAFGGTDASKAPDWIANFRWFIPHHDDEYTQIVKGFGPAFVTEFLKHSQEPQWAFLRHARVFSTGHSLGGGLAQEFAYSLPRNPGVPRVEKVYAFDPSPVTGYYSVDPNIRDANKQNLAIDRIYQRREILAILRSSMNLIHRPSARNPAVREVRYNLFTGLSPVYRHSIWNLTSRLQMAAEEHPEPSETGS